MQHHRSYDESSDDGASRNSQQLDSNVPHIQLHNEIAASKFSDGLHVNPPISDSHVTPQLNAHDRPVIAALTRNISDGGRALNMNDRVTGIATIGGGSTHEHINDS